MRNTITIDNTDYELLITFKTLCDFERTGHRLGEDGLLALSAMAWAFTRHGHNLTLEQVRDNRLAMSGIADIADTIKANLEQALTAGTEEKKIIPPVN